MMGDPRVPTEAEKLAEAATVVRDALTSGRCTLRVEKLAADGYPLAMLGAMIQGVALADTPKEPRK